MNFKTPEGKEQIRRYVKNILHRPVDVFFVKKDHEKYGAWACPYRLWGKSCLKYGVKSGMISQRLADKICRDAIVIWSKDGEVYRDLLWHEMGHLQVCSRKSRTQNEYEAHMWALNEACRRGYTKLFNELYRDVDFYWKYGKIPYQRARELIIKEVRSLKRKDKQELNNAI